MTRPLVPVMVKPNDPFARQSWHRWSSISGFQRTAGRSANVVSPARGPWQVIDDRIVGTAEEHILTPTLGALPLK